MSEEKELTLPFVDNEETDGEEQVPSWIWLDNKGNKKVNEVAFCTEFISQRGLRCINDRFCDVDGEISEGEIAHAVTALLTEHITSGIATKVKNLVQALKLQSYSGQPKAHENEIHVLNGLLKTDGEFIPEKRFCANRLNVCYNPNAPKPEKFFAFLRDLLDDDDIYTLWEYLGYLLIPSTKGQVMLSIIGNGGEGKSVLGTVLKGIFGNSLLTASFSRIESDRFFLANLQNKLVLLDDDMKLEALTTTGTVKSLITAQTPLDVEFKGKQSFQAMLYARLFCCMMIEK